MNIFNVDVGGPLDYVRSVYLLRDSRARATRERARSHLRAPLVNSSNKLKHKSRRGGALSRCSGDGGDAALAPVPGKPIKLSPD